MNRGRALIERPEAVTIRSHGLQFWFGYHFLGGLIRGMIRHRLLLLYLAITAFMFSKGIGYLILWLLITVIVPVGINVLQKRVELPQYVLSISKILSVMWRRGFAKAKAKREEEQALLTANELLKQVGLISYTDENIYEAFLAEEDEFDLLSIGQLAVPPTQIRNAITDYAELLGYTSVTILPPDNGYQIFKLLKTDPLDKALEIKEVGEVQVDVDNARFASAINEEGEFEAIDLKNVSLFLVAGQSGSGKTLSLLSGLFPYLLTGVQNRKVELYTVDGKGGFDLSLFGGISKNTLAPGDYEIDDVVSLTNAVVAEMNNRYELLKQREVTNGWNLPRTEMKHLVLFIDEAQNFLDATGADKETKAKYQQVIGNLTKLAKKARAVCITTILATQKSDATAIPTQIRDQAQLRLSFKQPNAIGSSMIFGEMPDDVTSPHELPRKPGRAIMMNERSEYVKVQFAYVTDETVRNWKKVAEHVGQKLQIKETEVVSK